MARCGNPQGIFLRNQSGAMIGAAPHQKSGTLTLQNFKYLTISLPRRGG